MGNLTLSIMKCPECNQNYRWYYSYTKCNICNKWHHYMCTIKHYNLHEKKSDKEISDILKNRLTDEQFQTIFYNKTELYNDIINIIYQYY